MSSSNFSIKDWSPTTFDLKKIRTFYTECPSCKQRVRVVDITVERKLKLGLHYLRGTCISCNKMIEAAGIGVNQTREEFERIMKQLKFDVNPHQRFEIVERDMWSYINQVDAICITTNGATRKRDGAAVMGRGCAKEATERYRGIAEKLGGFIEKHGNRPFKLGMDGMTNIISFPVKPKFRLARSQEQADSMTVSHMVGKFPERNGSFYIPGWACRAEVGIITESCKHLCNMARKFSLEKIVLPCPGVGAGELSYETIVKPVLIQFLDERFTITFKPRGTYQEKN